MIKFNILIASFSIFFGSFAFAANQKELEYTGMCIGGATVMSRKGIKYSELSDTARNNIAKIQKNYFPSMTPHESKADACMSSGAKTLGDVEICIDQKIPDKSIATIFKTLKAAMLNLQNEPPQSLIYKTNMLCINS